MSSALGENRTHLIQTPTKIDYAQLYESIGDIVIERAHAGDKECQSIYEHAYRKARKAFQD